MASKLVDEIVLSFYDSLLRTSDVELLNGPYWINDKIISFYFEYLQLIKYKSNNNFLFVPSEVTQCIKMSDVSEVDLFLKPLKAEEKDYIFFALNNNNSSNSGGTHWSLLVFSRYENSFFHFDSNFNSNYNHCKKLVRKIKLNLNCLNGKIESVQCLQQQNGYDCGIHVLSMVDIIAENIIRFKKVANVEVLKYNEIQKKRSELLKLIELLSRRTCEVSSEP